jgi:hypothetical protein
VNELAALGFAITLRNPVGLYMDDLDLTGWAGPGGEPVDPSWFQILRGTPGLIERAVFEVPDRVGYRVSDLTIGGIPISVGGQLVEHMTIKLVGLVAQAGRFANVPAPVVSTCSADAANTNFLYYQALGTEPPPGRIPAFTYLVQPERDQVLSFAATAVSTMTAPARPRLGRRPAHRSR